MNVRRNHRNVNSQQIGHDKEICLFMFTFVLKHSFLSMHCFCFFFLKGVLLYNSLIRVVLQPLFKLRMNMGACVCVCVRASVCVWVRDRQWTCFSMLLSFTRIDTSFYCDYLMLPNFCLSFEGCVFGEGESGCTFVFYFPLSTLISWFCFFVWLLTMSWPKASKPIPTEPLKNF